MVLVIGPGELPTEYQPHPPLLKMDVAPSPWLLEATEAHRSLFKRFPAIPLLPLSAPSQVGSQGGVWGWGVLATLCCPPHTSAVPQHSMWPIPSETRDDTAN